MARANRLRCLAALAAPSLLLACSGETASEPAPAETTAAAASSAAAPADPTALAVDGEGLRLFDPASGSARPLPFGTPWQRAVMALGFLGEPLTGRNEECEAGPLDFARWDGWLTLYGQDGAFVGWFADTGATGRIATAAGVGPGSTRADLEAAYAVKVLESSLGTEFVAGDLYGLLDSPHPDSPITALWAGTSCNFR
ncbi:MAG TPA: hypothetical protein VI168_19115 [Croceibacterium sp.]